MNKEPPAHKQTDPKKYPGQIFTRPEYPQDRLLKDYIVRKQESDSHFKKEEK